MSVRIKIILEEILQELCDVKNPKLINVQKNIKKAIKKI